MTNSTPDPEKPSKRGRFEIRTVIAVMVAVVLAGAVYVLLFGSPNTENRERDSPDNAMGVGVGAAQRP